MMPNLSACIDAIWQYFKAGHGKGPCNGPIGTAKSMADQAIQRGTTSTQSTDDFTTMVLGQQLCKGQYGFRRCPSHAMHAFPRQDGFKLCVLDGLMLR